MTTKRRSNWYIYVITLVVTGVIVAVVSSILLESFYSSQRAGNTSVPDDNRGTAFLTSPTYNFTVLLTLSEDSDSAPTEYMTLTYRSDEGSVILMPYLASSVVSGKTLRDTYFASGEDGIMQAISAASGVEIKKYVSFTKSTVTEFFNMAGNTTLSIPSDIKYEDKEADTVTVIQKGTRSFTGSQLYSYITLPDYGMSDIQYPCKVDATSISAFINQNFTKMSEGSLNNYAEFIINFTKTNIEQEDYEVRKQAILYTFNNVNGPCDFYIPYGEKTDAGYVIAQESWKVVKDKISVEEE